MSTQDNTNRRAQLSAAKRALLEKRLAGLSGGEPGRQAIPRRASRGPAPLSFAQRRLWFLNRLEPGLFAYNIPSAVRLSGRLDAPLLEWCFDEIVRRHESLRTTFAEVEGQPAQIIAPELKVSVPVHDLSSLPAGAREAEAARLSTEEARRPFDLGAGPLLRALLLRLGAEEHVLLLTAHHIISDGWSLGVLVGELGALYEAGAAGRPSPLKELEIQYADFAEWQRGWLSGEEFERQLGYWRGRLAGAPPSLGLPTDRARPAEMNYRGATLPLELSAELSESLRALSRREGVTLSMTLLAAFQALLQRFGNQDDVVVGVPVANRSREELEGLVGFFVNTLVMRTDLSGDPTFRELLGRVKEVALGAYAHQDAPFEMLVEELRPARDPSRNPLFQVIFDLQNAPAPALELKGLTLRPHEIEPGTTRFELEMHLSDQPEGVRGALVYSTSLFTEATVRRLAARFRALLEEVAADADVRLSRIELLTGEERRRLLSEWNDTRRGYPRESSIPELFEEWAARSPQAVALAFGDQMLTYEELNRRANQLAHYLRGYGVGEETRVGVCVERSVEMVVAVLGVLKAGGAYVPLDPAYPHERLLFMMDDAGARVLLTVGRLADQLPAHPAPLVLLDADWPLIAAEGEQNPEVRLTPESLAYVTYTSGSTGAPKGVGVPHRGVARLVRGADYVSLGPEEVFLQLAPLAFDASTFEIWGGLLNGSRLALMPPGMPSLRELGRALRRHRVTTLWLTAGLFHQMVDEQLEDLAALRQLLAGGDVLSPSHVEKFLAAAPSCRLVNGYGPTEGTTFTCCHVMSAPASVAGSVPVGRPIANTQVFILDGNLRLSPPGFVGELYAAGAGLARGYHERPGLTAERFIPHPFSTEPGARLYKTGDVGRWLEDGSVEFLGRADGQVKVRGHRVETGEVEAALLRAGGVRRAAVVAREGAAGDRRLVAYVVGDGRQVSAEGLQKFLRERLPEYMLPSAFVFLEELPLTPNGKVDRRALPAPEQADAGREALYAAPRTPVEEMLAGLWAEVLKVGRVGVHEDFFELGGHSLLVTQLVSRAQAHFGVELPLKLFFESATVAGQAAEVEAALRSERGLQAPPIVPAPRDGRLPLSYSQQRLWFLHELEPSTSAYNIPTAVRLKGWLDVGALERTLSEVARRHEILRTSYAAVEGQPVQVIAPPSGVKLDLTDLGELPEPERESRMRRLAAEEARRPFDLARGPLLRALLLRLGAEEHVLLLTVHHIVSDGWSQGVLVREVGALYGAFSEGRESPLAELPVQYADFAQWQRRWLAGEVLENHLAYWRRRLGGPLPSLDLPADRPRPEVQSFRGASLTLALPAALGESLRAVCRREGVTLFMLLVAAFKALLHRYTGQEDVVVGSPIANRNRVEVEGLIGFFVNTLVLRTDLSGRPTFRELLGRVRKVTLEAYAHQDMPFELLVEELQPERSLSRNPLFQVMFQLENTPKEELPLPGLTLSPAPVEGVASQFDLSVDVVEGDEGLSVTAEYSTDLFDAGTIRGLLERWRVLLEGVAADAARPLDELPLMDEAERRRVLVEWNQTARAYPAKCLPELFEERVRVAPEAAAIVCEGEAVTFGELNARANQLAHRLRAEGAGPDVPVALMLERSAGMVVALLGVLKAGAAYVPLDSQYPAARLAFMLDDVRAPLLLTQESLLPKLPAPRGARVILLDRDAARVAAEPADNPERRAAADNVAYVVYTSGSTGEPKGVLVPHRALSNHCLAAAEAYELRPADRVLQFASLSFDVAAEELFPTLLAGASVVLAPAHAREPSELLRLIDREGVSVLNLPAQFWQGWLRELQRASARWPERVRLTVVGSEKVPPEGVAIWRRLRGAGGALLNAYGVSEATITSTLHRAGEPGAERAASLPIGRPIANTQVFILDRLLRPAPIGVPGELHIGGAGLARGYHERPALTAERFIPHPFSAEPGARLYRTGDVARFLPGGEVEFLGRADEQVKVRGYRVETGEVEAALSRAGGVRRAAVVAREGAAGDRRLVAYVEPEPLDESVAAGPSGSALEAEQLAQWRTVHDDEIFNQPDGAEDPAFNISGWNSSYTGEPIPAEQMREWVDDAVERVLSRRPRRVLEIGCGTGLLLFRIAPHCARYVGTDFSPAALKHVREQLERPGRALPQVTLSERHADDFGGLEAASFDAVIINSVAQYFPSVDYLARVLRGAVERVAPGGFVFVGDVRSLPLLGAFHSSVELHKAEAGLAVERLRRRVRRRVEQEEELVIAPAFFTALAGRLPNVARVEVEPRRGRHRNELTQFRYQVMLGVGGPEPAAEGPSWVDWRAERWGLAELRRMLGEGGPQTLALTNVANARLAAAVAVAEALAAAEAPQTAGELKEMLRAGGGPGLDPEELWALGDELPYEVRLSWARHDASGSFDALFRRRDAAPGASEISFPSEPSGSEALSVYANRPLLGKQARQLAPRLRSFLKERLPEQMIPASFVILDELPLLPNGKIDRRRLPAPDAARPDLPSAFVAPRAGVEQALADVWADLLGVERVGVRDNFFELGGHSLLTTQLISRVRELFQVELPLRQVFEHPTIGGLAAAIEQASSHAPANQPPRIAPVSRQERRLVRPSKR
ncbi:MAG TPA: amino acid adenylation domain-containing protein [Pyrinomonadaceae bacterium]|jgi:amino acid adenylation domain-containing protein